MKTIDYIDYNGQGKWSKDAIQQRYAEYCRQMHQQPKTDLTPLTCAGHVYPVMFKVIDGIKASDPACAAIGVDFIQEDTLFPFGRILKSNTARAPRQGALLTDGQKERIRRRVVSILITGTVPREFREYAKLLKKIGLGQYRTDLEQRVDRANPYVMRWYVYLKDVP